MKGRLAGKVAVITGGAQGLGRATAARFVAEGAQVLIADVVDAAGEEAAIQIGARYRHCDVSDPAAVRDLVIVACELFGRLDVMVNVAAIAQAGPLIEISDVEYRRVMAINLDGVFYGTREAARVMLPRRTGAIINVSSIGGRSGTPLLAAYCASKAGILGLTRAAAMELAPFGIRVNSVSPGAMLTGMGGYPLTPEMVEMMNGLQPRGVAGTPEEVASAILYLASDEAANMIGHEMVVDGGATAGRTAGAPVSKREPCANA